MESKKILILCTGNSCRSQMADGFLQFFDKNLQVFSAGTKPEKEVNRYAIEVMKEVGIDISLHSTNHVEEYLNQEFDYVITVCDGAKEVCPIFTGIVKNRLHIGFNDPTNAQGSEAEILLIYRRVRDEIKAKFYKFWKEKIK